jgi:hypothetical protein
MLSHNGYLRECADYLSIYKDSACVESFVGHEELTYMHVFHVRIVGQMGKEDSARVCYG